MEPKEMRKVLKEAGLKCPIKNEHVIKAYNEAEKAGFIGGGHLIKQEPKKSVVKLASSNIYTYIGQGDTPPSVINFMGVQAFTRGIATEVKNPEVRAKLETHPCFVKGEVDPEVMIKNDEEVKKKVEAQRDEDVKIQIAMDRENRG